MQPNIMTSARKQLLDLMEQGHIPAEKVEAALAATRILPDGKAWLKFIDQLLLWLAGLALAFAAMFFIAYNWDEMGRFAKFGMVEALIVIAVLAYWKLEQHQTGSRVALLVASIFLGVLLALYGQTYQTGADPWQLFFYWAVLMLPWAIIGRFPAIWALWIGLINISFVLYSMLFRGSFWFAFDSEANILWGLFILNAFIQLVWELLSNKLPWLAERWSVRLLAITSGVSITWLGILSIVEHHVGMLSGVVWLAWMVGMYFCYRRIRPDLFMLAGAAFSGIVMVVSFLGKHMLRNFDAGGFLLLAIVIIGMGTGAAIWLRNLHREFQA